MNRYQRGKIYKIESQQTDKVYVGSTTEPTLARRLAKHRANYKSYLNGKFNFVSSFDILKYEESQIILIESYPCNNKDKLRARKQFHIKNNNCINQRYFYC